MISCHSFVKRETLELYADATPDRFGIQIYRPNGTVYYQAATSPITTGEVYIIVLE